MITIKLLENKINLMTSITNFKTGLEGITNQKLELEETMNNIELLGNA